MMTIDEREVALKQMENVLSGFYAAAVGIGNHPFTECNRHAGSQLPMESFEVDYLAEKLDCIFGGRIQAVER